MKQNLTLKTDPVEVIVTKTGARRRNEDAVAVDHPRDRDQEKKRKRVVAGDDHQTLIIMIHDEEKDQETSDHAADPDHETEDRVRDNHDHGRDLRGNIRRSVTEVKNHFVLILYFILNNHRECV